MKKLAYLVCFLLIGGLAFAQSLDTVQVSVTVEGTVFSLGLQDSSGAPWSGVMDFGVVRPGNTVAPNTALVVAACKSNTGQPWELKVSSEPLREKQSEDVIDNKMLSVYVGDPAEQGQLGLPGVRHATGELPLKLNSEEVNVYSSNSIGDAGHDGGWGTFVPVGFVLTVPDTQRQGTYNGLIRFTLTE